MKLSLAALSLVSAVSVTSAIKPIRASAGFLKSARKLEADEEEEEEEEYAFLGNYKLKLLSCNNGVQYKNPEDGEYESSSVVFRLCPASDECDDEGTLGCKSGYGDYVIGLNSFVQEYIEDKQEDMYQDDQFDMKEFAECREYEADQDADDDNAVQYYVGPACAEDGLDIKLDLFQDQYCSVASDEVTFEDISNGVSLPYSSGGLISNYCESCYTANDDGEYELSEMCMKLYENSGKCETEMETYHYQGQQTGSCETIQDLLPKKSGGAGIMFLWVIVIAAAVGVAYGMAKKKREGATNPNAHGLMS